MNFLIGGLSGMFATTCIQPIDFIKVQIQVNSEAGSKDLNPIKIAKEIYQKNSSIKPFYAGLDSALLRQAVYTSVRLGLFYEIKDYIQKSNPNNAPPSTFQNALASLFSGAVGSFVGNPADLALIRMQSDNNLPKNERRNYKHVGDALIKTVKEEGIFALWRGSTPTICRAMAMNFSLLVPFEYCKKILSNYIDNQKARTIASSMIAGICASILALPFDNVKTKLQKMKKNNEGRYPYNGVFDCFKKTALKEGSKKLWVGLPTFYIRVAPHAIISLVTNEFLRNMIIGSKTKKA